MADMPLSAIRELDEPFWFGDNGNPPTCRAVAEHAMLMNAVDPRHPIILSADGRVMDGMHRVCTASAARGRSGTPPCERYVLRSTPSRTTWTQR